MDRYTSRNEIGQGVLELKPQVGEWAVYPRHNMSEFVVLGESIDLLAAYEDTGLTPEEIIAMKVEYSDTFQAHLNQMCDLKDKRIAELEAENARLNDLVNEIEKILRKGEE
ncbi:MAG: hypothetical protein K2N06_05385 [Oscillospiraceae bacterium]|nr:hypothetical protein [Oscillospiraceae bacterium]